MLLDNYVKVKINSANKNYYENKGYEIPTKINKNGKKCIDWGSTIVVKIQDLSKGSNAKIHIRCDNCGKETTVTYNTYVNQYLKKGTDGKYYCKSCSKIHVKQTTLQKYGVDHIRHVEEIHNKIINTNIEKYGGKSPAASKDVVNKTKKTNLERYGVTCPLRLEENIKLAEEGCMKKYGTLHPFQSDKYWEEQKAKNLKKYGYEWIAQVPQIREKMYKSFQNNNSMKSSSQQRYLCNLYNGKLNYMISYYFVDIYIEKDKICCEYDGGAHNLNVFTGRLSQEEFDKKEMIREKTIREKGNRIIRIISLTDYLPSDEILLQMYSESLSYFNDSGHTWRTYDIDKGIFMDAEHKDGESYDFGDLRKIQKQTA